MIKHPGKYDSPNGNLVVKIASYRINVLEKYALYNVVRKTIEKAFFVSNFAAFQIKIPAIIHPFAIQLARERLVFISCL